ncbi:hypothetical protein [Sorangium sp. So ce1389]|uniref:hypothetical protein n=1 Tax=Sorangium sp. So ce1389 TaxID=3133336 RepID=UPI003F5EAA15
MSVDARVVFKLVAKNGPQAVLDALLGSKWYAGEGGCWLVPLGEDTSEWRFVHGTDRRQAIELLNAKMNANEAFGIRLWWGDSEIGGEFLIFSNCDLLFSPTMNRVKQGQRTTDVSWYLSRLVPIFTDIDDVDLESWVWSETC